MDPEEKLHELDLIIIKQELDQINEKLNEILHKQKQGEISQQSQETRNILEKLYNLLKNCLN